MREKNGWQDLRDFYQCDIFFMQFFLRLKYFKKFPGNTEIRHWVIQETLLLKPSHIEITLSVNGYALFVSLFLNVFLNETREQEKTTSKCQLFCNLKQNIFVGKKSAFLFARKKSFVLHLSLCLWKCVFVDVSEALICNILLKAHNRETISMYNIFLIR